MGDSNLAVSENLMEQPRPDCLSGVHRHYRTAPILVPQEMVAAASSDWLKAGSRQRRDQFCPGDTRGTAHAASATVIR